MTDRSDLRGVVGARAAVGLCAGVFSAGLGADILTKVWAVTALSPETPVRLVGDLLRLYLIRNPGAAFSLGTQYTWIFTILAAAVLLGVGWKVVPRLRHRGWSIGVGLVSAGIAGNLIDRLVRPPGFGIGHVVDFLQLPHWPIFNVADMCVTGGAAWILWIVFRAGVGLDGQPDRPRERSEGTKEIS